MVTISVGLDNHKHIQTQYSALLVAIGCFVTLFRGKTKRMPFIAREASWTGITHWSILHVSSDTKTLSYVSPLITDIPKLKCVTMIRVAAQ